MPQLEVRPAYSEDRETVLAFCAHTWENGDYIERVWDDWLRNQEGQLLTATLDGQPVGIVHIRLLNGDDAWLEGLRVDPAYRRQGIARALSEAALLAAMRRDAIRIRLTTESHNPSIHLYESLHLRRVGGFSLYNAVPLTPSRRATQEQLHLATPADLDTIIDYLNVSNIFPLVGGLYYMSFTAYAITEELLRAKIAAQQVYLLHRWERLDGLAITEPQPQEKRLSLGYIVGTTIEAISLLAYNLRLLLGGMNLENIRAYTPDLVLVHDAFNGVEYESTGMLFYTYERGLI